MAKLKNFCLFLILISFGCDKSGDWKNISLESKQYFIVQGEKLFADVDSFSAKGKFIRDDSIFHFGYIISFKLDTISKIDSEKFNIQNDPLGILLPLPLRVFPKKSDIVFTFTFKDKDGFRVGQGVLSEYDDAKVNNWNKTQNTLEHIFTEAEVRLVILGTV